MSNENIFGGLPESVASSCTNGCVSIPTIQTARLIMMNFFLSDVFICFDGFLLFRLDSSERLETLDYSFHPRLRLITFNIMAHHFVALQI